MKRKAIIITIIVVALILVAVASWLIYKKYFKKDGTEDSDSKLDDAPTPPTITAYPIPPEVKDVKSFQAYANGKGYKPKLVEDNKWGPASAAAWKVWGNDYKKFLLAISPVTVAPGQKNVPLYAKFSPTYIWNDVNDWIPYRLANQNEFIGTTDGTIVENSNKNKFYKLNFTVGGNTTTKYVRVDSATMSSNWASNIKVFPTLTLF